jgi:diamine N-acetyltransferase
METSIRKAAAEDYSSMCELFDEIDSLHRDHLPHIFQKPNGAARERDYYLELIADEKVALFVAEAGGQLIGFVHAFTRDAPDFPVFVPWHYAIVDSIVVKSEFQNHRTGKILMGKIQEWAVAKGAASIELNVYEFNQTAISFYENLGFRTFSRKISKELRRDKSAD